MVAEGLRVMINSDDPTMFHTDIGTEFVEDGDGGRVGHGADPRALPDLRRRLLAERRREANDADREFERELDGLEQELRA